MVQGCRSSGLLDQSAIVYTGRVKVMSFRATSIAGPCIVKLFDGIDNTGLEIARISIGQNIPGAPPTIIDETMEFDLHGVICNTGLYYEETSGDAAAFVEFV